LIRTDPIEAVLWFKKKKGEVGVPEKEELGLT
jgi:hypothetical protein